MHTKNIIPIAVAPSILLATVVVAVAVAGSVSVPHSFQPGDVADANQVNANFTALAAGVNDNDARITANDARIAGLTFADLGGAATLAQVPEAQSALGSGLSRRQQDYARAQGLPVAYVEATTGISFVLIPPGEFWMGSPTTEVSRGSNETLQHVRLTQAFYLSAHEVTNAQYKLYDAGHTSTSDGDQQPVTEVSHDDATNYAAWLSTQTGDTYALPTEAQWEYACRAGTTTPFTFGPNINPAQVNYYGAGPYDGAPAGLNRGATTDVGIFPANAWGLYDVHGNVWEWCADWYDAYSGDLTSVTTDPTGPASGTYRVIRGGSWYLNAQNARSAARNSIPPGFRYGYVGFRLARPVTP